MPLPFGPHNGGLIPPDELKEPMPLPEVLSGTSFVSSSGRIYRLFGHEEELFSMPVIPPRLAASKVSVPSLEEALRQIESFSSPMINEKILEQPKPPSQPVQAEEQTFQTAPPPAIQLFQALEESAVPIWFQSQCMTGVPANQRSMETADRHTDSGIPLKLVKRESALPNALLPAKEIVREGSHHSLESALKPSPKPGEEKRTSLRVISDDVEEPFVVPFAKPESLPEETETKKASLKIVTEVALPVHFPKTCRKCWQHRRKGKIYGETALYRKRFLLPPAPVCQTDELTDELTDEPLPEVSQPEPPPDIRTDAPAFQWSAQLDSLMQTAGSQIQMLADHLVVQSNQGIKAVCFKSVFPGDGCSTILLCAVKALMERNYRILLIDTHHRHIDLPKQLNVSGNLNTGNEVYTLNNHFGLWVWQESKTAEENAALLAEVIAANRGKYDLILLDDGSITESPLTEFVEFWNRVELGGVVLVSNTKRPSEMSVSHISGRLRQHHIHVVGIAENYV